MDDSGGAAFGGSDVPYGGVTPYQGSAPTAESKPDVSWTDRVRALRNQRGQAAYVDTTPDRTLNPGQITAGAPGLRKPVPDYTPKQRLRREDEKQHADQRKARKESIAKVMKSTYPAKEFGKVTYRVPRYTAKGQEMFGLNARVATNEQLANRAYYGFTGDGEYFRGNGMYQTGPGGQTNMRHTGRFSGEGGFFDDIGNFFVKAGKAAIPVAKDIARVAAPIVGNAIVPGLGGVVGAHAANTFLGEGEYETAPMIIDEPVIKYNNLINSGSLQTRSNAIIESAGDETGDLIFTHNEYIHDLTSRSLDFHTLERFEINPGVFGSFPLLSQFAQHYEEYDFLSLIFEYKSLVTEGNSSAAGSVMLCPNYNASNPNLPDKRSVENATGSVSNKVTNSFFCGIECANDKTAYGGIKYVRTVDIDSAGRRMYDLGFLQIATQGVPPGLAIGELWCRYKVRLSKLKVGGLKLPSIGSGALLTSVVPATGYNMLFASGVPDFTHTPSIPAAIPGPNTLLSGDDISLISLKSTPYGQTVIKPSRTLEVQMACVGGSQLTINAKWYQHSTIISPIFHLSFDGTDCTIPYTIGAPIDTRDTLSGTGPILERNTDNEVGEVGAEMTTTVNLVFGTPGQLGKINLRVKVTAEYPGNNIDDGQIAMASIGVVRTA